MIICPNCLHEAHPDFTGRRCLTCGAACFEEPELPPEAFLPFHSPAPGARPDEDAAGDVR